MKFLIWAIWSFKFKIWMPLPNLSYVGIIHLSHLRMKKKHNPWFKCEMWIPKVGLQYATTLVFFLFLFFMLELGTWLPKQIDKWKYYSSIFVFPLILFLNNLCEEDNDHFGIHLATKITIKAWSMMRMKSSWCREEIIFPTLSIQEWHLFTFKNSVILLSHRPWSFYLSSEALSNFKLLVHSSFTMSRTFW